MHYGDLERASARGLICLALSEDLGLSGDVTTAALVGPFESATVNIVCRATGVVAGLFAAEQVFAELWQHSQTWNLPENAQVEFKALVPDGAHVSPGSIVGTVSGNLRLILVGERTALNFLSRLSGVATLTRQYVDLVAGTRAAVYDTRKTLPGWRVLDKYAVRAGGGRNHRQGLFDMVLIKDNHLAAWRSQRAGQTAAQAVRAARERAPAGLAVEIEVESLNELRDALAGGPDIVLLDNLSCDQLAQAVALRDRLAPGVVLEASGGVSLQTATAIARTGVERISVGALTHSAPGLDLAFDWP